MTKMERVQTNEMLLKLALKRQLDRHAARVGPDRFLKDLESLSAEAQRLALEAMGD